MRKRKGRKRKPSVALEFRESRNSAQLSQILIDSFGIEREAETSVIFNPRKSFCLIFFPFVFSTIIALSFTF
jgi:hypothetical protein